jgi:hypothetical protein
MCLYSFNGSVTPLVLCTIKPVLLVNYCTLVLQLIFGNRGSGTPSLYLLKEEQWPQFSSKGKEQKDGRGGEGTGEGGRGGLLSYVVRCQESVQQ